MCDNRLSVFDHFFANRFNFTLIYPYFRRQACPIFNVITIKQQYPREGTVTFPSICGFPRKPIICIQKGGDQADEVFSSLIVRHSITVSSKIKASTHTLVLCLQLWFFESSCTPTKSTHFSELAYF